MDMAGLRPLHVLRPHRLQEVQREFDDDLHLRRAADGPAARALRPRLPRQRRLQLRQQQQEPQGSAVLAGLPRLAPMVRLPRPRLPGQVA